MGRAGQRGRSLGGVEPGERGQIAGRRVGPVHLRHRHPRDDLRRRGGTASAALVGQPLRRPGSSPVPIAWSSGLNTVEKADLGTPSAIASTSRSTPVSCSAISPAEPNLRSGSWCVARRSSRANDSCCSSSGTASGKVNL